MDRHARFEAHASHGLAVQFAHDWRSMLSSGMDNRIKLWAVADWSLKQEVDAHSNSIN